ncbi:DUF6012 family protein [Paenibacillus sp. FSL R5-0914]|uniref:DUF6012 family protein n=1 Tax=Paenibacillus sp. FSL R5-0914 TaxID=2921665 RepID=UPI0030FBBC1C
MERETSTMLYFLSNLHPFGLKLTESFIIQTILERAKRERKDKSNKEIYSQGLNIFKDKKNKRVSDLIEEALQKGYLTIIGWQDDQRIFTMTEEGLLELAIYWTDGFSEQYKSFALEVNRLFEKVKSPAPPIITIMKLYKNNYTLDKVYSNFIQEVDTRGHISREYHSHLLNEFAGVSDVPDSYYMFHLAPKLYVPCELQGKKVTLEIQGIDTPENLVISSPFPNKSYYAAGLKNGRKKSSFGFYPIIASKETFPEELEILLRWRIEEELLLDHQLNIKFDFMNHEGNLFSSDQRFSRSAKMNEFSLVSSAINSDIFSKNRKTDVVVKDIFNHFELRESISLSNFPVELHSLSWSGSHYGKWHKQRNL